MRTGEWSFFAKREPGPFGNTVLMHTEAGIAMKQFDGNLLALIEIYGIGFKPERFDAPVDRRRIQGFLYTDTKTRFPVGLLVNNMHDPRAASVSTLRDEDGQAVAVFMPFGREPE